MGWRVCGLRYTAALSLSPKGRYVTALRLGDLGRVRRTPSGLSRPPRGLPESRVSATRRHLRSRVNDPF